MPGSMTGRFRDGFVPWAVGRPGPRPLSLPVWLALRPSSRFRQLPPSNDEGLVGLMVRPGPRFSSRTALTSPLWAVSPPANMQWWLKPGASSVASIIRRATITGRTDRPMAGGEDHPPAHRRHLVLGRGSARAPSPQRPREPVPDEKILPSSGYPSAASATRRIVGARSERRVLHLHGGPPDRQVELRWLSSEEWR